MCRNVVRVCFDLIRLVQHRDQCRTLANAIMKIYVLCRVRTFLPSCATVSLLMRNLPHGTSHYLIPVWYVPLGLETIFHSIEQIK
jgi:hypothetical protein